MVYLLYHLSWGTGNQKSPVHPMGLPNEALLSTSHGIRGPLAFVVCQESSSIFLGTRRRCVAETKGEDFADFFWGFSGWILFKHKGKKLLIIGKKLLIIKDFPKPILGKKLLITMFFFCHRKKTNVFFSRGSSDSNPHCSQKNKFGETWKPFSRSFLCSQRWCTSSPKHLLFHRHDQITWLNILIEDYLPFKGALKISNPDLPMDRQILCWWLSCIKENAARIFRSKLEHFKVQQWTKFSDQMYWPILVYISLD